MQPNLTSVYVYNMINHADKNPKVQQLDKPSNNVVLKYQQFENNRVSVKRQKHNRRHTTNQQILSNTLLYGINLIKNYNHPLVKNNYMNDKKRNGQLRMIYPDISHKLYRGISKQLMRVDGKEVKFSIPTQQNNTKIEQQLLSKQVIKQLYSMEIKRNINKNERYKQREKIRQKQKEKQKQKVNELIKYTRFINTQVQKLSIDGQIMNMKSTQKIQTSNKILKFRNYTKLSKNSNSIKKCLKNLEFSKQQVDGPKQIAQKKFQHYIEFLSTVQLAYNSYRSLQSIKKYDKYNYQRYKIFIGSGNNKNLIKSLFKKRWWWKIVDKPSQANFIWTQIKIDDIHKQQTSGEYYSPMIFNQVKNNKAEYLFKIFNKNDKNINLVDCVINGNSLQLIKQPLTIHNHFSNNQMIGNKKALFKNLTKYCKFHKKNSKHFIPLTFHIENIKSPNYQEFEKYLKKNKQSYWIIKPGQNSNRGTGIEISNNLSEIKKLITRNSLKHTSIVQQYISNLFLFQKRKFDIRTYVLINRVNNIFKAYWYRDGYIRTSSQQFNLDDLDPLIHLTNDAIQKYGQEYGKYEEGNKISYMQFQRYLDFNFAKQKYQISNLIAQMKNISTEVIKATYFKIDNLKKLHNMEIFGLDFILDQKFKIWLLEVNTNPCLELSSQLLARLIPNMVQNALRITIDPLLPPLFECPPLQKSYLSDNFFLNNRFELIFDSQFDRNIEFENFCQNETDCYQQQNDQFQNQGQQISLQY